MSNALPLLASGGQATPWAWQVQLVASCRAKPCARRSWFRLQASGLRLRFRSEPMFNEPGWSRNEVTSLLMCVVPCAMRSSLPTEQLWVLSLRLPLAHFFSSRDRNTNQ